MLIRLSLSSSDGGADYSDDVGNLREQVFENKRLYATSFMPSWSWGVLDGYREGHAAIEVQVRGRTIAGDRCNFKAVYYVPVAGLEVEILGSKSWPRAGNLDLCGLLQNNLDQPVLVGVIEIAQDGKNRRQESVRSVVRLNTLNSLPDRQAELSDPPVLRFEVVRGVTDGESASTLIGRWIRLQFVNRDRVDEVVEGRPHVVDCVTQKQGPPFERRRLQDRDDDAVTCGIAIDLAGECVRMFLYPGIELLIEKATVFVRPLELGNNAV